MVHRTTRLIIRGKVQGVSFRAWTVREAAGHGIDGWVRNREDGSVEALLAGETNAVGRLIAACRRGPSMAVVTDVIEAPSTDAPEKGFFIRT